MAKFSRAHYELLKAAIIKARSHSWDVNGNPSTQRVVDQCALEIGIALAKDNRAFDLDQFLSDIRGYREPKVMGGLL